MMNPLPRLACFGPVLSLLLVTLSAGCQQTSGSRLAVASHAVKGVDGLAAQVSSGQTQLRGMNIILPTRATEEMFERVRQMKADSAANHVRLFMFPIGFTEEQNREFGSRLREQRSSMDINNVRLLAEAWRTTWFPLFEQLDLPVILVLPTSKVAGRNSQMWDDAERQKAFVDFAVACIREFKNDKAVLGFDLLNEPFPPGSIAGEPLKYKWEWSAASDERYHGKLLASLYNDIIRQVREFDVERLIVLEPGPIGRPTGFPQLLDIVDDDRLVFSFHFYAPDEFTHMAKEQFVRRENDQPKWLSYPTPISSLASADARLYFTQYFGEYGSVLGESYMEAYCAPAVSFLMQREARTGRRPVMYVGEFGTVRWQDEKSQIRWYADALDLFEKQGWGWGYFSYTPDSPYPHQATPFLSVGPEGSASDFDRDVSEAASGNNDYFKAYADQQRPSYDYVAGRLKALSTQ